MKIGMTLGGYAPFHRGHCLCVDTALSECDKVIVMVYDDHRINIPYSKRADWIRNIYSDVRDRLDVIECYDCPEESGYTPEIIKAHDDYILWKVGDMGITHFYSSERYGEHVSKALRAEDRRVDQARILVPISGTRCRVDPKGCKQFIPDIVYWDLIKKICFIGSESTGKSTITRECAKLYNTVYSPEYGEEYWKMNNVDGTLEQFQLLEIAKEHVMREYRNSLIANKYLFCDTSPFITWMFCMYYHGKAPSGLELLMKESLGDRYDHIFVCDTDIPFDPSNGRRSREINLQQQDALYHYLETYGATYTVIRGTVEERLKQVVRVVEGK